MSDQAIQCPSCNARNRLEPEEHRRQPRCGRCSEPLPWLVSATDDTFAAEVDVAVPVLVDLWAPWCGPCLRLAPELEALARDRAGALKIVKVNADENRRLAADLHASPIPKLVLFKGGKPVDTAVGARPKEALAEWLAPHLLKKASSEP